MLATSHALSGAVIGLSVTQPIVAIPLAFVSHFILDAFPHIGLDEYGGHLKKQKLFHKIIIIDAALLSAVFMWLILAGASWLVFVCVVAAGSPDAIWAYRYIFQERKGKNAPKPKSAFSRFHSAIQWSQTLRGAYLEIPFALFCAAIIASQL
jgi:hypothetical protein